jgi:hypothetical protein
MFVVPSICAVSLALNKRTASSRLYELVTRGLAVNVPETQFDAACESATGVCSVSNGGKLKLERSTLERLPI